MTGDNSKLAVDAIRLSLSGNQFTADAYWIPFLTPAALPLEEKNLLRLAQKDFNTVLKKYYI